MGEGVGKVIELVGRGVMKGVEAVQVGGIETVTKPIEIVQNIAASINAKNANKIAKEANEIAKVSNAIGEKSLKDSQKDYMPKIEFVKDIKVDCVDLEGIYEQTVFDFHDGIICDDNGEPCLDDFSEYIPITLKIKNVGESEITGIIIDYVYVSLESKNTYETKLANGVEVKKALSEGDCNCLKEFTLLPNEKREVTLLFACEELNWVDADGLIEAAQEGYVLIEMDMRLFSTNDSVYEQKSLVGEYKDGELKECSYGSIGAFNANNI